MKFVKAVCVALCLFAAVGCTKQEAGSVQTATKPEQKEEPINPKPEEVQKPIKKLSREDALYLLMQEYWHGKGDFSDGTAYSFMFLDLDGDGENEVAFYPNGYGRGQRDEALFAYDQECRLKLYRYEKDYGFSPILDVEIPDYSIPQETPVQSYSLVSIYGYLDSETKLADYYLSVDKYWLERNTMGESGTIFRLTEDGLEELVSRNYLTDSPGEMQYWILYAGGTPESCDQRAYLDAIFERISGTLLDTRSYMDLSGVNIYDPAEAKAFFAEAEQAAKEIILAPEDFDLLTLEKYWNPSIGSLKIFSDDLKKRGNYPGNSMLGAKVAANETWTFYAGVSGIVAIPTDLNFQMERVIVPDVNATDLNLMDGYLYYIADWNIYRCRFDGSQRERLGSAETMQIYDGWIYYTQEKEAGSPAIMKMRLDGSEETLLCEIRASELMVVDDTVYFLHVEEQEGAAYNPYWPRGNPYMVKTDGTGFQRLSDTEIAQMVYMDDAFYYIISGKNHVWKSGADFVDLFNKIDGVASIDMLNITKDELIFYSHGELIRAGLNNTSVSTILESSGIHRFYVAGDWLYYVIFNSEAGAGQKSAYELYRTNLYSGEKAFVGYVFE